MVDDFALTGLLFILVGPTAVGKTTLIKQILGQVPGLAQLPTATTRPIRSTEREGREHYFFDDAGFQQLIDANALLENQVVHDYQYGIIRARLEEALAAGQDQIADIEVLGAAAVRAAFPANVVSIFVSPPDGATLEARIRGRGDKPEEIERRLRRAPFEMQFAAACDYLIINDDLATTAGELLSVLAAERRRRALRQFVTVAVHIHGAEAAPLPASPEAALASLPCAPVRAQETAPEAVQRLLAAQGLDPARATITLRSYHLLAMDTAPSLVLIYDCAV